MTSTTSILGLKTYNATTDASTLTLSYINDVSGSSSAENLQIIDSFARNVITGCYMSASTGITISGSKISLTPTGVVSGSYNQIEVDTYGRIISGSITAASSGSLNISGVFPIIVSGSNVSVSIANSSQVSSGSSSEALVSASALAHSDYGKRTAFIPLNTTTALSGTETNYVRIPSSMDNWKLVSVNASSGSSSSGSPTFLVRRSSASSISKVSMLTTNVTIDEGEYDSSTALTAAVIDTSNNTVLAGDKIWASSAGSSLCGTGVIYAGVSVTFQNQP